MSLSRIPWLTLICLLMAFGMAAQVPWQPEASQIWWRDWHAAVPLITAGAAWLGGVSADPDRAPERRMQVISALMLLVTVWLAPIVAEGWFAPEPSARAAGWWLGALGASLAPATVALPLSVIGGFSLFSLANHPVMPRPAAWLAWLGCTAFAVALLHQVGGLVVSHSLDAPVWVFAIGLLVLPFQMQGNSIYAAGPLWVVCLSALTHLGLNAALPDRAPLGSWLLASVALGLPVWLVWLHRLDRIARFDRLQEAARELQQHEDNVAKAEQDSADSLAFALHEITSALESTDAAEHAEPEAAETPLARKRRLRRLRREVRERQHALEAQLDSPEAQEGADKYTRE